MKKNIHPADAAGVFSESSVCPYYEDSRTSITEYVLPDAWLSNFHTFLDRGYRRYGNIAYRPRCYECSCCRPLRLETERFRISKSQKRIVRKNRDIRLEIRSPSEMTQRKLSLFVRYQKTKHGAKEKLPVDFATQLSCIHHGHTQIIEMDFFLEDRLVGVGIVDEAADSLSSNYFYYDTDFLHRQLGTFSIIQEILLAREMGKKYHYLGYYIEGNPKMAYKKLFRPNQELVRGEWRDFLR